MVSDETLLNDTDWKITFTLHIDSAGKPLFDVISHNNKPIAFFSRSLRKSQRNYTIN